MTVVGENETMVRATSDAEGNVNLDIHAPLGLPTLSGKVCIRQGKSELLQGTVVYSGEEPRSVYMVWFGIVGYGMIWYGMVWYGMVWYGMVRHNGMVWYGKSELPQGTAVYSGDNLRSV